MCLRVTEGWHDSPLQPGALGDLRDTGLGRDVVLAIKRGVYMDPDYQNAVKFQWALGGQLKEEEYGNRFCGQVVHPLAKDPSAGYK